MSAPPALPDGLLLAYYGDDFTGSTDTMEVLTFAGLETVLFLEDPTPARLTRFPGARAVGIAGVSRSRDPDWMREHLPGRFAALARLGAPILQYKVCSTFDSAPHVGSIGAAIDLGVAFAPGSRFTPVVVGAPRLRRYQAFGNLFAAIDGVGYRLDRHPTMAHHPVTPMAEADLRLHLARQTGRRLGLVDLVALKQGRGTAALAGLQADDCPAVFIDLFDDETSAEAGRLVWDHRGDGLFTASSSGLQYALVAHWRAAGLLGPETPPRPAAPVDRIAVVSGSASPATAGQIAWAEANGFEPIRLDAARVAAESREVEREGGRLAGAALEALGRGRDPLVFSAQGPADPALAATRDAARRAGLRPGEAGRRIGRTLAVALRRILDEARLPRVAVAGGDTSGEVAGGLGLFALTALAPLAPGSPLCRAWSDDPGRSGLEVALKGGQVGPPSFFGAVKAGAPLT
ncbi:four-carbon acid sugar kinase family protein [Prosthecomicrobium sp. N25]|uniref:four-carbon acid sugar kinase family protein n=1 Tax=Prosthecomicrobium sp. N25 TaxID=3129254 RepID=UPI003076B162